MAKKTVAEEIDWRVSKDDLAIITLDKMERDWVESRKKAFKRNKVLGKTLEKIVEAQGPTVLAKFMQPGLDLSVCTELRHASQISTYYKERDIIPDSQGYYTHFQKVDRPLLGTVTARSKEQTNKRLQFSYDFDVEMTEEVKAILDEIDANVGILETPKPHLRDVRRSLALTAIKQLEDGDKLIKRLQEITKTPIMLE
jgi:hypothetical protein